MSLSQTSKSASSFYPVPETWDCVVYTRASGPTNSRNRRINGDARVRGSFDRPPDQDHGNRALSTSVTVRTRGKPPSTLRSRPRFALRGAGVHALMSHARATSNRICNSDFRSYEFQMRVYKDWIRTFNTVVAGIAAQVVVEM